MKIKGALMALMCFVTASSSATYNIMTRWEGDKAILNMYGNYGHPLGEEIRLNNQRKKSLHIFNLLEAAGEEVELFVALHPFPPSFRNEKTVQELSLAAVEEKLQTELKGREEFNPVYDKGTLLYQKWLNGKMLLEFDGKAAGPARERAFDFFGKRGDNILIGVDGKLEYIDEVKWQEVESLKDYSIEQVKWINDTSIVAFAEHDMSSRRYIAKTRFRTDEDPALLIEDPGLQDVIVGQDPLKIAGLRKNRDVNTIVTYLTEEDRWADLYASPDSIYLLGIVDGEIVWWNGEAGELHFSGSSRLKDIKQKTLELYPHGEYSWGQEEPKHLASPEKVIVLIYPDSHSKILEEKGLSGIKVFESRPRVWLVHERYRSSFDELPEKLGHVFLAPENSRVYYNKSAGELRSIDSITLRPAVPTKYLLMALILILAVLILYDILKKTREVTS